MCPYTEAFNNLMVSSNCNITSYIKRSPAPNIRQHNRLAPLFKFYAFFCTCKRIDHLTRVHCGRHEIECRVPARALFVRARNLQLISVWSGDIFHPTTLTNIASAAVVRSSKRSNVVVVGCNHGSGA